MNVFSLNTKGLNVPEKRCMLLQDLKRHKTDLALLQETHFKSGNLPVLRNRYFPMVCHAMNGSTKTRGVSILISNIENPGNVRIQCLIQREDICSSEGR